MAGSIGYVVSEMNVRSSARLGENVHLGTERAGDAQVVTVKAGEGVQAFPGVTVTLNGLPPGDAQVRLNGRPVQAAFRESACQWPRHFVRLEDGEAEQVIEFDLGGE